MRKVIRLAVQICILLRRGGVGDSLGLQVAWPDTRSFLHCCVLYRGLLECMVVITSQSLNLCPSRYLFIIRTQH